MNVPDNLDQPNSNNSVAVATKLIAEVRTRCIALGLTPKQFADLLLPEALLAMMVAGMPQEEVEEAFAHFVREEISAWFLQVKRTAGYCDCEREAFGEHAMSCSRAAMPVVNHILGKSTIKEDTGSECRA